MKKRSQKEPVASLISAINAFSILLLFFSLSSCGMKEPFDVDTPEGKQAIIDQVNGALNVGDCQQAIKLINPLYHSKNVDNEVRMLRASAYGCGADAGFFRVTSELSNAGSYNSFWALATKVFPSSLGDGKTESAWIASDTLLTVVTPGAVVPSEQSVFGAGALDYHSRTNDSNTYLFFASMAVIGTTQYRYGKTAAQSFAANFSKLNSLPWVTSTQVVNSQTACGYASSIVNLYDSFSAIGSTLPALGNITTALTLGKDLMDLACEASCRGSAAGANVLGLDFTAVGCTLTAAEAKQQCFPCPLKLRERNSCTGNGYADDKNPMSCAAAGIIIYINQHISGWQ